MEEEPRCDRASRTFAPLRTHSCQGFTDAMFNLTRRPDGSPRPSTELLSTSTVGGKAVTRVVSPQVASAAAQHFGCDGLPGAQLEDEGGGGSAGSHWEYLLFQVRRG